LILLHKNREKELLEIIRKINYGEVKVKIHQNKIKVIEKTEKIKY